MKLYPILAVSLGALVLSVPVAQAKMTKQQAIEACRAEARANRVGYSGNAKVWVSNCVKRKLGKQ